MYIWSFKKLTNDFIDNKVSEKEKFKYFFTLTVLELLVMGSLGFSHQEINFVNTLGFLIMSVVYLVAFAIIYRKNKIGDNKNFIERYICLSLPTLVQANFYCLILAIVVGVLGGIFVGEKFIGLVASSTLLSDLFVNLFLVILANYWIYKSIEKISKN